MVPESSRTDTMVPVVEIPTLLGPLTRSCSPTSTFRFVRSRFPSQGVSSSIVICSALSTVISGIPCQARTRASVIRTVIGNFVSSIGKSTQALIRHWPVGSAIWPDQRYRSSPSLVNVRFAHSVMLTIISTSLEPSRSVLTVAMSPSFRASVSAKEASWNGSIFVVLPKLSSGVSRKVLT